MENKISAEEAAKLLLMPDEQYPTILFCIPIPGGGLAAQAVVDFEDAEQRDFFLAEWRMSMAEFLWKVSNEDLLLALADMFEQHCRVESRREKLPEGAMSDFCISANENAAEILLCVGLIKEDSLGYYTFTEKYSEMLRRRNA